MVCRLKKFEKHCSPRLIVKLEAEKSIAEKYEGQWIINELKDLAEEYSLLETKTPQRAVRMLQSYEENWKRTAKDFLEEVASTDLLEELDDVEETQASLTFVVDRFNLIK